MPVLQEQIESLYQQASSEYLQGDFASALASWRQLLALAPADERAQEGCRLCELLVQVEPGGAAVPESSGPVSATEAIPELNPVDPAVDLGIEQSLEELDHLFEDGFPGGAAPAPAEAAPAAPTPTPEVRPSSSILEPPMFDLDLPEDPVPSHAHPAVAADELGVRVAELVSEAQAAYAAGNADETRALLQRVFILDESHAGAVALMQQLDGGAGTDAAAGENAAGHGPMEDELFADPTPEEIAAADAQPASPPLVATPPQIEPGYSADVASEPEAATNGAAEPVDAESLQEDLAAMPQPDPVAKTSGARSLKLPQLSLSGLPRWALPALGAVALLGVAVYFAMGFLGGDDSASSAAVAQTAAAGAPPAASVPAVAAEPAPAGPQDASGATQAAPAGPVHLPVLLAEAEGQMERGEYQAAILSFNRILEAQPAHEQAIDGLTEAGDLYRAQRAIQEKWETIRRLFDEQDYRTALTLMYRLPESEQGARLARFQRNGWYNLGVQALVAADCDRALEHLDEANRLDPDDAGVHLAITLAERCQDDMSPRAFAAAVAQLEPRSLGK